MGPTVDPRLVEQKPNRFDLSDSEANRDLVEMSEAGCSLFRSSDGRSSVP